MYREENFERKSQKTLEKIIKKLKRVNLDCKVLALFFVSCIIHIHQIYCFLYPKNPLGLQNSE